MFGQKGLSEVRLSEGPSGQQEGNCYVVIKGRWFWAVGAGFPKGAGAQWASDTELGQVLESMLLPVKEFEF